MKARVVVTLKSGVLDPQGKAIEGALKSLGVEGVASVRQGKVFDVRTRRPRRRAAKAQLQARVRKAARQHRDRKLSDRSVMKAAVVVFPGSNREGDMSRALTQGDRARRRRCCGTPTRAPRRTDLVALPGGFSFGDYLRCGAIAGRAAIMDAVRAHAARGGLVLGVCNGFQISARRPFAGRADAQRLVAIRLPADAAARSQAQHHVHPPIPAGSDDRSLHRAWRGQLRSRRRDD